MRVGSANVPTSVKITNYMLLFSVCIYNGGDGV